MCRIYQSFITEHAEIYPPFNGTKKSVREFKVPGIDENGNRMPLNDTTKRGSAANRYATEPERWMWSGWAVLACTIFRYDKIINQGVKEAGNTGQIER